MKKTVSLLLALLLLLGVGGCAAKNTAKNETQPVYDVTIVDVTETDGGKEQTDVPTTDATETDAPETDTPETDAPQTEAPTEPDPGVSEDGVYDSKDEVALYIHLYRHLPSNYITKKQAEALGWPGGDLRPYAPGKCIGGSHFGNYEGLLPSARGREWTECDIDTMNKKSRGAKRIIFSNDGLIYYTDDHYESFTQLYDGWED